MLNTLVIAEATPHLAANRRNAVPWEYLSRRQGSSVDELLQQSIKERAALSYPAQPKPELPAWHLGRVGALHRRDIYDDAR